MTPTSDSMNNGGEIFNRPAIGWFPPHMHRAFKRLTNEIKNVDLVIEVRDARLPLASSNLDLVDLLQNKQRMVILNKTDLIENSDQKLWVEYFNKKKITALFLDSQNVKNIDPLFRVIEKSLKGYQTKFRKRGIRPPMPRILIAGMPNVGKSTIINRLIRRKRQSTEARPGVTKSIDWITLKDKYLLMDSPGLLLPRLDREIDAFKLGWIGTIRDSMIGEIPLATELAAYLSKNAPQCLSDHYKIQIEPSTPGEEILTAVGTARGLLKKGGEVDLSRTGVALLLDFRNGQLGKLVLEDIPR